MKALFSRIYTFDFRYMKKLEFSLDLKFRESDKFPQNKEGLGFSQ